MHIELSSHDHLLLQKALVMYANHCLDLAHELAQKKDPDSTLDPARYIAAASDAGREAFALAARLQQHAQSAA